MKIPRTQRDALRGGGKATVFMKNSRITLEERQTRSGRELRKEWK
jgi:hypothetical protein